jgi:hypothetical protein
VWSALQACRNTIHREVPMSRQCRQPGVRKFDLDQRNDSATESGGPNGLYDVSIASAGMARCFNFDAIQGL